MGSSDSTLLAIASKGPIDGYDDALERLHALETELDPSDGLFWFNRLYIATTRAVSDAHRKHRFDDPRFVERLDCHGAGLYFVALAAHLSDPGSGPSAWEPILRARTRADIRPLQFALAGLNAHVNRDLPVALVTTFMELDGEPRRETQAHTDYQRVCAIQESTLLQPRVWLPASLADAEPERAGAELGALLELWSLRRARDAAWVAAEVRWALRGSPVVARHQLDALDHLVQLGSRGLLLSGAAVELGAGPASSR
jgi:uncharacterized protein DUF5995